MTVHNLGKEVLDELTNRRLLFVNQLIPPFIISTGCHIFNIENRLRGRHYKSPKSHAPDPPPSDLSDKRSEVRKRLDALANLSNGIGADRIVRMPNNESKYKEFFKNRGEWLKPLRLSHTEPKDTRFNLLFIAPPGNAKSLYLDHLFSGTESLFGETPIRPVRQGSMTGPAWIGTVANRSGEYIPTPGEASVYPFSIHACEEFHGITAMLGSGSSPDFEDQLLMSLEGGKVKRSLAGGSLVFETNATLVAGTQPSSHRLNLDGGLTRRLGLMFNVPTPDERLQLMEAVINDDVAEPNVSRIIRIRDGLHQKIIQLRTLESVIHNTEGLSKIAYDMSVPHFELDLLKRMGIGWSLMTKPIDGDELYIDYNDPVLSKLLIDQIKWRDEVKFGTGTALLTRILKYYEGSMPLNDLTTEAVRYNSFSPEETKKTLENMIRSGLVRKMGSRISLSDKQSAVPNPEQERANHLIKLRKFLETESNHEH